MSEQATTGATMSETQAAEALGLVRGTLNQWRRKGLIRADLIVEPAVPRPNGLKQHSVRYDAVLVAKIAIGSETLDGTPKDNVGD